MARARLIREARALATVVHPNVVEVYDVGTDEALADDAVLGVYIVMEKLEGATLRAWMSERRTWQEVVEVFVAAGRGLCAAHEQRLLHRDFKPDNVMITRDGRVKVLDFGLARVLDDAPSVTMASADIADAQVRGLTETGVVMGTPRYMAPEQHVGKDHDPAVQAPVDARAATDRLRSAVGLTDVRWWGGRASRGGCGARDGWGWWGLR